MTDLGSESPRPFREYPNPTCREGTARWSLQFGVLRIRWRGYYRSFRHTVTQRVAQNEQRVDENVTGDRDVDRSGVVQLESRFVENSLERIHRIDRQTDREDRHYLKYIGHRQSNGELSSLSGKRAFLSSRILATWSTLMTIGRWLRIL